MKKAIKRLRKKGGYFWKILRGLKKAAQNDFLRWYDSICFKFDPFMANAIVSLASGLPGALIAIVLFGASYAFAGAVVAVAFVGCCFAVPSIKKWFKHELELLKEQEDFASGDDEV